MSYIKNFAFFWVGEDIKIPSYLTKSINYSYKDNVNIFMLTDKKTPYVDGVTKTIRSLLPKEIMLARLKAYSELRIDDQVIFLDADSLVLKKFKKFSVNKSLILFRREKNGLIINHNYPEHYPEFIGRTLEEMMPFLFGAIVTTGKKSFQNFLTILEHCKSLPDRFHRWYGDQYALKLVLEKNLIQFAEENFSDYIDIISTESDLNDLNKNIVTFKGPRSKHLIHEVFNKEIK